MNPTFLESPHHPTTCSAPEHIGEILPRVLERLEKPREEPQPLDCPAQPAEEPQVLVAQA